MIFFIIFPFSQIDLGLNYKVCNFFSFATCFSLWHMKSYTACLVGCTRILIGSWYRTWIVSNLSLYIILHVLLHVLLRFLFLLKNAFFNVFYSYLSRSLHLWEELFDLEGSTSLPLGATLSREFDASVCMTIDGCHDGAEVSASGLKIGRSQVQISPKTIVPWIWSKCLHD